ncbi:MAG: hypothetical protein R2834_13405 [Rhodothermales bacterium]
MATPADRRLAGSLFRWMFGMVGSFLLVLSLPRLVRVFARRAVPRMASEMIWIALTGLLFEKFTEWLMRDDDEQP